MLRSVFLGSDKRSAIESGRLLEAGVRPHQAAVADAEETKRSAR